MDRRRVVRDVKINDDSASDLYFHGQQSCRCVGSRYLYDLEGARGERYSTGEGMLERMLPLADWRARRGAFRVIDGGLTRPQPPRSVPLREGKANQT